MQASALASAGAAVGLARAWARAARAGAGHPRPWGGWGLAAAADGAAAGGGASAGPQGGGEGGERHRMEGAAEGPGWERTGRVAAPYRPPPGPPEHFAVVQVGALQYKVMPDDRIWTERLPGVRVNDTVRLSQVLLVGTAQETLVGRPVVDGAEVVAAVEAQAKDAKQLVFKKKRRKNYRRKNGHRQSLTCLRVLEVAGIPDALGAAEEAA